MPVLCVPNAGIYNWGNWRMYLVIVNSAQIQTLIWIFLAINSMQGIMMPNGLLWFIGLSLS